jgi:DNA-directed RNA polymerase specialized sigma24 family protein
MTDDSGGSVTRMLFRLNDVGAGARGADEAARLLWERYFTQLVARARSRLQVAHCGARDEEDVALSAFKSVVLAIADGRFPDLNDRDDLWRLLVVVTARKAINHARAERREKRGGGHVVRDDGQLLAQIVAQEPSPEHAALMADECRRLLSALPDAQFRRIALLKMDGHSDRDVAAAMGLGLRTVERKLKIIRAAWLDSQPGRSCEES